MDEQRARRGGGGVLRGRQPPGGGAILSYRAPGQSGFALIASALPHPDGMLAVRIAGQAHTPADDLPAALATIRAVLGGDVPEIPNERSPK